MAIAPEVYEFGDFVLDVGERRLLRSGPAVSLPSKAHDVIVRRDPALVHMAVAPQWDWLRIDPRFAQRLEDMGLPTARTYTTP